MSFQLYLSDRAKEKLALLEGNPTFHKNLKAVVNALSYLENNPKHPGLNTHKFDGFNQRYDCPVFEVYAQNQTPGAYRIFWCYGPQKNEITILDIVTHPNK